MTRHGWSLALALLVVTAGCRAGIREISRETEIGKSELVGIRTTDQQLWAAVRTVKTELPGILYVSAEPHLPGQTLEIQVLAPSGSSLPLAKGPSPLETPRLPAGIYYVVVQAAPGQKVSTRADMSVLLKPENPDAKSGEDFPQAKAIALELGRRTAGDVNFAAADATDWFKFQVPTIGDVEVKFDAPAEQRIRGNISAELVDTAGTVVPVPPTGLKLQNAVAGEYYVKVSADSLGAGAYSVVATYKPGSPEANSGEDATADGATLIDLRDKNGRLFGSAKDEVSFDKQDATDWFRVDVPQPGKLSVVFKPKDRSSRVRVEFVRNDQDEDGERVRSGYTVDVVKQSYWVKVYAPEKGDGTAYTLDVELNAAKYIDATVVEIDKKNGCFLMVNRGSNHGVRSGVAANVMQGDQVLTSGVVESAFPAISKVRMFGECRFNPGTLVKIQDMSY